MRLFTSTAFALCIVLGGCSTETERGGNAKVDAETQVAESENVPQVTETPRTRISTPAAAEEPEATPITAPTPQAEVPTTATEAETTATTVAVSAASAIVATPPLPEITPQASKYPVEMARTVELRKQLQQVSPEAGALSDQQATTLERFARHMFSVSQTDTQLPGDQKKELEDLAGKVQYQAEAMREGRADATFQNRLAGVKRLMESMQNAIATEETAAPQQ